MLLSDIYQYFYPIMLIGVFTFVALVNTALLMTLYWHNADDKKLRLLKWSLCILVLTSIPVSIIWILHIFSKLLHFNISRQFCFFIVRIFSISAPLQYFSIGFLFSNLSKRVIKLQAIDIIGLSGISLFFLYSAGTAVYGYTDQGLNDTEAWISNGINILYLCVFAIYRIYAARQKIKRSSLPTIIIKQYKIYALAMALPFCLWEVLYQSTIYEYLVDNVSGNALGQLIIVASVCFVLKNVMRLRFLNLNTHVQATSRFHSSSFRDVLEALSKVGVARELNRVTQEFFNKNLRVPRGSIRFHMRSTGTYMRKTKDLPTTLTANEKVIEGYLGSIHNYTEEIAYLNENHILNYDEIEFDNFYSESSMTHNLLNFLELIEADIFLPIIHENELVAYIIVERNSRDQDLYTDVERDEMIVYANYLGQIVHFLQNHNFKEMLIKQKEYEQDLYEKHLQIEQFRETVQRFLEPVEDARIGTVFYKDKRFSIGNHQAIELMQIDPNEVDRHPITQAFHEVINRINYNRSSYSTTTNDPEGNPLYITGIPHETENAIIFTIHRPSMAEIIHQKTQGLTDRSDWDYILALETTKSGQVINKLYPGASKSLLAFKTSLLKLSLSKKAIMIEVAEADTLPTAEIIHEIGLRENLEVLKVTEKSNPTDIALKLFGINPLFSQDQDVALLEHLDKNGTLLIKNIEFLGQDNQTRLLEYIKFGTFTILRSDKKILTDVRLIFSTTKNLHTMVLEGKLIPGLYAELSKTSVMLPTLLSLPEKEVSDIINQISHQAISQTAYQDILALTSREEQLIMSNMPASLTELKTRINHVVRDKTEENNLSKPTVEAKEGAGDSTLIQAAYMGKRALRDPAIMATLWERFKNQNKIATFLGVNRSSVSRRCREYNLEE